MTERRREPPAMAPSPWVRRHLPGAPHGRPLLDVACGRGRHLRLALAHGLSVVGIDRDLSGVSDLASDPRVELIEADLEDGSPFPLAGRAFGAVVVTNYLWRPILPAIVESVAADGLLIYETFTAGQERYGRPSNPQFLLQPGELIHATRGRLVPIAYQHATVQNPTRIIQRIVAVGAGHPWVRDPPQSTPAGS